MTEAARNTTYALISDETEALRLNQQHERIKALFPNGWLPDELKLKPGDKVLDSGTGTGIWALDVASGLNPEVEIDGIDITDRLFPASHPSNMHFFTSNVLKLPESFHDKYTLVHQRFLVAAFNSQDWQACLKNIYAALRPGGWLKMEEFKGHRTASSTPGPYFQRLVKLGKTIEQTSGIHFAAVDNIDMWLREAGFVDIRVEQTRWLLGPGQAHQADRDLMKGVWRAMRLGALNMGSDLGFSDEEWDEFVTGVDQEMEENEVYMPVFSFTARKPSS